jgi:tyrosinase
MAISRRNVLLQGAVIGAGVLASNVPAMKALAAGQPPERRTLQGLAWNDPIVATYRDGVGLLKQKAAGDKSGWVGLAGIHGLNLSAYHFCPHGNWYFLPWHRAYILTYERFIRELTGNRDFALPYWDWTSDPTMPEVFLKPTTPDGKKNWLFVDDQDFGREWKRSWPDNEPMPPQIVGPSILQDILHSADYEQLGTSRPLGQDSLDPSWVLRRTGAQGTLERLPHNMVHNNIGGWMPRTLSPRDPIFFMHHCNIDRIWAVWNSLGNDNSAEPLWTDMTFTNNFINTDGSAFSPKVSELFIPESLGYTYGLSAPLATAFASPNLMALRTNLTTLWATPSVNTAKIRTYTVAPAAGEAAGTATKPFALSLNIDPALIAAVVKRKPVSSGAELLNFAAAREQSATGPRVLAFVRDVDVTQPEETEYRVFLDRPGLPPQVEVADPSYVGSFGVFVHSEHGDHGSQADNDSKPSFVFDLTNTMQRVYGNDQPPIGPFELRFVPVASKPNAQSVGTIKPGRVEVAFLNA